MSKLSLYDYIDASIFLNGTIRITERPAGASGAIELANKRSKAVIFKTCAPCTDCISKIYNTQVDNAKDLDDVMLLCNLIEYNYNHSKTSGVYGNIAEMSQMLFQQILNYLHPR